MSDWLRAYRCEPEGDFLLEQSDLGTAWPGRRVLVARNTNGSGAPGCLGLEDKNGVFWFYWPTTSGVLRFGNSPPQADGSPADTSGTAV